MFRDITGYELLLEDRIDIKGDLECYQESSKDTEYENLQELAVYRKNGTDMAIVLFLEVVDGKLQYTVGKFEIELDSDGEWGVLPFADIESMDAKNATAEELENMLYNNM
ncbi:hypothetical protein PQE75_gp055 [Bacillus phage vB_BcoS-136]|uniref:Uncharacterized protein n=1 Tax=Bacillus phage vB_BcoS-136 TaxID=2419619 RepID=A0A3G3BVB5_9CAUD|nr:hypothetical protein PQE75_gp055 [Bacillus phage vB_BcoS-136]AYP68187.1 hypothetical protein vBBcoS136_00055 [Bacillus phage vB_BcoS-136]